MPSPSPGTIYNGLNGVEAFSSSDVWAVGGYYSGSQGGGSLIEHWDGAAWTEVPNPGAGTLFDLAGLSSNDIWAVGGDAAGRPGILHWDGSSWSVVPTPDVGFGFLKSVTAVSPTEAWAVGYSHPIEPRVLIEHWDGSQWTVVPGLSQRGLLEGVAALSATDVWVVGSNLTPQQTTTLILHWDGSDWIKIHPQSGEQASLQDVAALSATDVWAVGTFLDDGPDGPYSTFTMHWDGNAWSMIPSPNRGSSLLFGVATVPPDDVWAVGSQSRKKSLPPHALIEHWDGTGWTIVPSPATPAHHDLQAVEAVSATDVWAVGPDPGTGGTLTLIEHYSCG